MKTFLLVLLVFLSFQIGNKIFAQGEAAVPILSFNPSPKFNAMGMIGTSIPNDDPFGFYYNPAQLGNFSRNNNFAIQIYPSKVDWLNFNLISYDNTAFNLGYNFKNLLNGLSLSAGFGFIHSKMDYGTFYSTGPNSPTPIGSFDSYDEFNAYGLGVGIEYNYILFNIGITYKKIQSFLGPEIVNNIVVGKYEATPSAIDYGFLLTVPVVKLINPEYNLFKYYDMNAVPYFNVSVGYARLNQGGEVYYVEPAQADPLPRTARLGYTLSAGFDVHIKNISLKVFGYDFSVDADDELINQNFNSSPIYSYQSGIGDIQIGRNLIELKSSNKVTVHKGNEFSFFDTFTYMIGRYDGGGFYNQKSSGIGIRARGILQILKTKFNTPVYNYIADHFDIQYYSAKLFEDTQTQTDLKGIGLTFSGFFF